jgi:crotonobetainyl-CoA:carnitine CoA-transferase CaiB-like acyl-CoA transferase
MSGEICLAGLKILDLLGADVVKIENPKVGDPG